MYTTLEASRDLKINPGTFRKRANTMGIAPMVQGSLFMWSDRQVDAIQSYKRIINTNFLKFSKKNISIVEFYLTHNNNTQIEIAEAMGLNVSRVNKVLTEFLNTGFVMVESKINVDNFYE